MSATLDNPETILACLLTLLVTLGISYIFYPAFQAALHDDLEFDEANLTSSQQTKPTPSNALLSLVIPAYNEEERIPIMFKAANDYLGSEHGKQTLEKLRGCSQRLGYASKQEDAHTTSIVESSIVEWVIVNDGSKDQTDPTVRKEQKHLQLPSHVWRLVNLRQNGGKGAAVKVGMNVARGDFRLMVDADGATDFGPGLERLVESLAQSQKNETSVHTQWAVFGSRAHLQDTAGAERSFVRTLLMHAFHFFVSLLISSEIQDTQCGFKLFSRDAAVACFGKLQLRRWAFDTEIVVLCSRQGTQVLEVGVPWQEIDGSKLHTSKLALALISISMLRDMLCVRLCYSLRIWIASKPAAGATATR